MLSSLVIQAEPPAWQQLAALHVLLSFALAKSQMLPATGLLSHRGFLHGTAFLHSRV